MNSHFFILCLLIACAAAGPYDRDGNFIGDQRTPPAYTSTEEPGSYDQDRTFHGDERTPSDYRTSTEEPGVSNPTQFNGPLQIQSVQGLIQQLISMGRNNPMFRMMTEFLSIFIRFLQSFPTNAPVSSILKMMPNIKNLMPNVPGASSYNFGNNRPNKNNGPQFDNYMPNIPNFRRPDLLQKGINGAKQAFEHGRNGVNDVYNLGRQGLNVAQQGSESFKNGVQDTAKELAKKGLGAAGKGYKTVKNGVDNIRNSLPGRKGFNQDWNAMTDFLGSKK